MLHRFINFNDVRNMIKKGVIFSIWGLSFPNANAQNIIAPNPSTPTVVLGTNITDPHINCDMFQTGYFPSLLSAAVYDDITNNTQLFLYDDVGGTVNINIPNALLPDVAIADENVGGPAYGTRYMVSVIFRSSLDMKVYLNTYDIGGAGTGTLSAGPRQLMVPISAQAGSYFPHIDMFADPNYSISGVPSMHKCVLSWDEGNRIYSRNGDLFPSASLSAPSVIFSGAQFSDVAASYNANTGVNKAYFIIGEAARVIEFNCNTNTITSSIGLAGLTEPFPRIEAMGIYTPNGTMTNSPWNVVAPRSGDIAIYNTQNIAGISCAPLLLGDNRAPAIACGVGTPTNNGYCDENFVFGWLNNNQSVYLTQTVDYASSNTVNPNDYYQVNSAASAYSGGKSPFALSSSSNWGEKLLTVWFENARVYAKLTGDNLSYRPGAPTGIKDVSLSNSYQVYPNPASNNIMVTSNKKGQMNQVSIYNILGSKVYSSTVTNDKLNIDVSGLASGTYSLIISGKNGSFSKKIAIAH